MVTCALARLSSSYVDRLLFVKPPLTSSAVDIGESVWHPQLSAM